MLFKKLLDKNLLINLMFGLVLSMATIPLGFAGAVITNIILWVVVSMQKVERMYYLLAFFLFLEGYADTWGGYFFGIYIDEDRAFDHLTYVGNNFVALLLIEMVARRVKMFKINSMDQALSVFMILAMLSTFLHPEFGEVKSTIMRILQFVLLYVMIRLILSKSNGYEFYIKFLVTSFGPLFVFMLLQIASGYVDIDTGRPQELIVYIPIVLAIKNLTPKKAEKFWLNIIALFTSFMTFFAGSRRIIISILIAYSRDLYFSGRRLLLLLPVLVMVGYFSYQFIPEDTRVRIEKTSSFLSTALSDENQASDQELNTVTSARYDFWQYAFNMFLDYPLLGVGFYNNSNLLDDYGAQNEARAHNFYLEVLADMGLIGLTVLLVIVVNGWRALNKSIRHYERIGHEIKSKFTRALVDIYLITLISAFFGGAVLYSKSGWIMFAILASVYELARRQMAYLDGKAESANLKKLPGGEKDPVYN